MDFFADQNKEASETTLKQIQEWCDECFDLRDKKKALEDETSSLETNIRKLQEKIVRVLEEHGLTNFPTPRGTVSIREMWSVKTPKSPEEKEAFFEYLKEKGIFEEMVSINSQTLNAFYKEEKKAFFDEQQKLPAIERQINYKMPGIGEPTRSQTLAMPRSK